MKEHFGGLGSCRVDTVKENLVRSKFIMFILVKRKVKKCNYKSIRPLLRCTAVIICLCHFIFSVEN